MRRAFLRVRGAQVWSSTLSWSSVCYQPNLIKSWTWAICEKTGGCYLQEQNTLWPRECPPVCVPNKTMFNKQRNAFSAPHSKWMCNTNNMSNWKHQTWWQNIFLYTTLINGKNLKMWIKKRWIFPSFSVCFASGLRCCSIQCLACSHCWRTVWILKKSLSLFFLRKRNVCSWWDLWERSLRRVQSLQPTQIPSGKSTWLVIYGENPPILIRYMSFVATHHTLWMSKQTSKHCISELHSMQSVYQLLLCTLASICCSSSLRARTIMGRLLK